MTYGDYIKIYKSYNINSSDKLFDMIQGKNGYPDLRKNFIFRGLKKWYYELLPSASRSNDSKNCYLIDDYLENSKFILEYNMSPSEARSHGYIDKKTCRHYESNEWMINFKCDKYLKPIETDVIPLNTVYNQSQAQVEKEKHVLLNFLNFSDKSGLKIPSNDRFRKNIHKKTDYTKYPRSQWPEMDYFEIMSLAQHYGLPTRTLDWSYDYKTALYFAVIGLISDTERKEDDCILWALNYRKFEDNYSHSVADFPNGQETNDNLHFYRAEYNMNSNLNAQKGLFTIWIDNKNNMSNLPLDIEITRKLDLNAYNNYYSMGSYDFYLDDDEKIFYKFIIPGEIKKDILNELYDEGYSEEYLYPGYSGVTSSIKNKAHLDKYLRPKII